MTLTAWTEYRVVEVATVTDDELTRVLNENVRDGWQFDGMQFAMRESSKRPSMAFVLFTRAAPDVSITEGHESP